MKDLSNKELINKFRAMCNLFIIYGKFQKEQDFNEANKISDELLSRLSAGEEAVKNVAELENDKRELVEALDKISNPIFYLRKEAESSGGTLNGFAVQLSNDANYLKGIARTALAKHKEAR